MSKNIVCSWSHNLGTYSRKFHALHGQSKHLDGHSLVIGCILYWNTLHWMMKVGEISDGEIREGKCAHIIVVVLWCVPVLLQMFTNVLFWQNIVYWYAGRCWWVERVCLCLDWIQRANFSGRCPSTPITSLTWCSERYISHHDFCLLIWVSMSFVCAVLVQISTGVPPTDTAYWVSLLHF